MDPGRFCQLDNGFVPILPVQPNPHTSQPWVLLNTLVATFSHRMPVNWCRWAKKQIEEGSKTKLCFTSCIYFNPDCTWMGGEQLMFGQLLLFLSRFNFFLADSMFSHQLHPFLICSFFSSHADWHCFNHTQGNQSHPSEKNPKDLPKTGFTWPWS